MKKIVFIIVTFYIAIFAGIQISAQTLANPFEFPIQLSGSFCDLRTNHFHSGIDIRTRGAEGQTMHAIAKGYISRISVSPWGYGNAIYITHPKDSLISVYGHMQRFTPRIAEIVKKKQYESECFAIDFNLEPEIIPVNQGDIIGYSGNSGSSGGPHLHLEIRDARTNEPTDPLIYYKSKVTDTKKPVVKGLIVYPIEGKGVVNGSYNKQKIEFKLDANGNPIIKDSIEAWGEIGFSVKANDRMDGTGFSYGIKDILQTVDSIEVFRMTTNRFSFEESKFINSCTDYEEWKNNHGFYIKTFVDPGNNLRMVASRNSGKININEERTYKTTIILTDQHGNRTKIPINIKGKKQAIMPQDTIGTHLLRWYESNDFRAKEIRLNIPKNSLYNSIYMRYNYQPSNNYYSAIHKLHNKPVPLHASAQISILMDTISMILNTSQYGIVKLSEQNGQNAWIGGKYHNGWIEADISDLGTYAIARDITPPKITPIAPAKWRDNKQIKVIISDDLSGVAYFRGEIDGKYALFEYDGKKALLTYKFDNERLYPGYHHLKLVVKDGCGNEEIYTDAFTW